LPLLISLAIVGVVLCITGLWLLLNARRNRQPTINTRQEAIWAITLKKKRRKR
jgi:hypothetical protein